MKNLKAILFLFFIHSLSGCGNKAEEKGFAVDPDRAGTAQGDTRISDGIAKDTVALATRPSNVLLTGIPRYRLTTIYKVNYNEDRTSFIGSNDYHHNYGDIGQTGGNQWHNNYLPGFEAAYGYNMVNVSHYDIEKQKQKTLFEKPVLIKTLYYPSFSKDTLNYLPVTRNFFMVSVYDNDTNKDGFINIKDLRHFYHFGIDGGNKRELIPVNYSVYKSEYDPANDFLHIFAKLDNNQNGQIEDDEDVHVFWIDLKNPAKTGRQY